MALLPYVLDFTNIGMNTTIANDKLGNDTFELLINADLSEEGKLHGRLGIDDAHTDNPSGTRVNAIAPWVYAQNNTSSFAVAIVDDEIWYGILNISGWTQIGTTYTSLDNFPQRIAWGINANDEPVVYFADTSSGVYAVELAGSVSATKLGSDDDVLNPWSTAEAVEFFLNRLFIGKTNESGLKNDRLRWSVVGDDTDFHGSGTGFFDIRNAGSGTGNNSVGIVGLRVYRNRLYIALADALYVLTGTTNDTFGSQHIRDFNGITGSTMWTVGDVMYFIDYDGIWEFNGTTFNNLVTRSMSARWNDLSDENDIRKATASWSNQDEAYYVYFPSAEEEWVYYYKKGRWVINQFASADSINVISPPMNVPGKSPNHHRLMGTVTNGKVFRYGESQGDDGNAFTITAQTGVIRLGEIGGAVGNQFRIHSVDVEAVEDATTTVMKLQFIIDGTAGTQESLTIGSGGLNTHPTVYNGRDGNSEVDLTDANLTGHNMKLAITATSGSLVDIRRITIWYESLAGKGM